FGEYILRDNGDLAKHQLMAKAGRNARDEPAHPSREAIHCTRTRNRRLRNDTIAGQIRPMRVDLSSQAYFRNPAAQIARMRAAGAVVEVRFPIVGTVWTTTTQELADRVLKDDATFTLRRDDGSVAGFRWWMPGILRTLANNMLSADEPDHRRLRDVVDE